MPADIALDTDYMAELQDGKTLQEYFGPTTQTLGGIQSSDCEERQQGVLSEIPKPPDLKQDTKNCTRTQEQEVQFTDW